MQALLRLLCPLSTTDSNAKHCRFFVAVDSIYIESRLEVLLVVTCFYEKKKTENFELKTIVSR